MATTAKHGGAGLDREDIIDRLVDEYDFDRGRLEQHPDELLAHILERYDGGSDEDGDGDSDEADEELELEDSGDTEDFADGDMQPGQAVTVIRGVYRGQDGTIVKGTGDGWYRVRMTSGVHRGETLTIDGDDLAADVEPFADPFDTEPVNLNNGPTTKNFPNKYGERVSKFAEEHGEGTRAIVSYFREHAEEFQRYGTESEFVAAFRGEQRMRPNLTAEEFLHITEPEQVEKTMSKAELHKFKEQLRNGRRAFRRT